MDGSSGSMKNFFSPEGCMRIIMLVLDHYFLTLFAFSATAW